MKNVRLSPRLKAVVDYINHGAFVADIGTDHGYVPVYLAQAGIASSIIASDISAGSLEAARRSAEIYGLTDAVKFIVAPGLSGIGQLDADTIVIAGMGGETISGILRDALWTKHQGIKLILQPQSKIDVLFKFLYDEGYKIIETKYVREKRKKYVVICVNNVG